MKRNHKLLVCLAVVFCAMTALLVSAEAEIAHGIYGNHKWTIDDAGTLTVSPNSFYGYEPWDSYADSIKKAVIQSGVTEIDYAEFCDCTALTSVTIPNSVTRIASDAFFNCSSLASVTIPASVTSIGSEVFYNCSSLTSIKIPVGVTEIGNFTFCNCSALGTVTLPSGVKSIGSYAFCNCSSLTSITIPASVTAIGDWAFYGNGLTSVTVPGSVKTIGTEAFGNCVKLKTATLQNGVTTIGDGAFTCCSELTTVTIPASVNSIGLEAFTFCYELNKITVSDSNTKYCAVNNVLFSKDMANLVCYPAGLSGSVYHVPSSVKTLARYSFFFAPTLKELYLDSPDTVWIANDTFGYSEFIVFCKTGSLSESMAREYAEADETACTFALINDNGSVTALGANSDKVRQIQAREKARQIVNSETNSGMSPYQKALALHDWLTENAEYDMSLSCYAAADILLDGTGVCQAYTEAYAMLLDLAGIPNKTETGQNHIWNLIRLDGQWFHVDVTWDDPVVIGGGHAERHTYFCIPDSVIHTVDSHIHSNGAGSDDYTYYYGYKKGLMDSSIKESMDTIQAWLDSGCWDSFQLPEFYPYGDYLVDVVPFIVSKQEYSLLTYPVEVSVDVSGLVEITPPNTVEIGTQPVYAAVEDGEIAKYTVQATGLNISYQWQFKTPNGNWTDTAASGNKTAELNVSATKTKDGYQYRCVIMDFFGSVQTTEPVPLIIKTPLRVTNKLNDKIMTDTVDDTVQFTVAATGDGLTYQWQYKAPGKAWVNATASGNRTVRITIPVTKARDGYLYRCKVTDQYEAFIYSNEAKLTVKLPFLFTSQPKDLIVTTGTSAKFTAPVTGDDPVLQWQYKTPSGNWTNTTATGCKTANLTVPGTKSRDGYQYRCVATNKYGDRLISDVALLNVKTPLGITAQPSDRICVNGDTAVFSVSTTGDGLTWQWQFKTSGSDWKDTGATGNRTATLKVPVSSTKNGYQYRCRITDKFGEQTVSSTVTLKVKTALKITAQPAAKEAASGTNAVFSVSATGDGLSWQWQYKAPSGSWTNTTATGCRTNTLTIGATNSRNGYQYRCNVTDQFGETVTSEAALLTVHEALKISGQPTNAAAATGSTAKFTVTASGDGLSWQWQFKTPTGAWTNTSASGCKTATLSVTTTAEKSGYQYRCVIKDQHGASVTSGTATLTVQKPLKITAQPADRTVTAGTDAKFTVTASGTGLTYQWQYRASATGKWNNTSATGNKTATLTVATTAAKNGYQYQCIIKDFSGASVTTKEATLTVE